MGVCSAGVDKARLPWWVGCAIVALASVSAGDGRAENGAVADAPGKPVIPPASGRPYLEYGVALAAEIVASAGPACTSTEPACILGSGGGVVVRAGWRPSETLYLGGAYEISKLDPHALYRLALLQQVRAELRRYIPTGRETSPFLLAGVGVVGYGNDWWPIDTWGPSATLGAGIEVQLGTAVLDISLAYRPMYLRGWTDSSTLLHDAGVAQFVGFEASVEQQDAL